LPAARIILLSLLLAALSARASDFPLVDPLPEGGAGSGGVGRATRSIYRGEGARFDYLPLNIFLGERAYLHGDRIGIKKDVDSRLRLDIFLAHRYEGTPLDGIPPVLAGMAIREQGTDLGFGYRTRTSWGTAFGEVLHNVDGASRGRELRLGVRQERAVGRLRYWPQATLARRDAKLNNYYYGVSPGEATATRPAHEPGGGLNLELAVYAAYPLSAHWKALAGVSATHWSGGVRRSPIVEGGLQPALSFGLLYDHSPQPWPVPDARPLLVKLYYGKATDCDLAKILLARCTSTSTPEETRVASLELGRTLIERLKGWNLDIAGYVGLLHHDENARQPDSWQLNAYFKPYWYGLPWGHRVKTRLGIGTGLSYASRVPFVEGQDQMRRNRPSSKLLTYLDPSIDFSLGDLVGERRMKDAYLGIGVSHRSGIFGFSQLLNNVNGGSNYIYTYVEFAI
jgi:outer membrane protein